MPDRPKPEKKIPEPLPTPAPVEVVASIPLSVQLAPESLASLGAPPAGTAEPVTVATAAAALGGTVGNPEGATPVTAPQATTTTTVSAPAPKTVSKSEELTLAPKTTEQEDIVTAGQRFTSNVWELTQASVAVMTTLAMIYTAIMQIESLVLTSAFFLIIGTYFNRTNSHRIGGVGPKATDNQPYLGR